MVLEELYVGALPSTFFYYACFPSTAQENSYSCTHTSLGFPNSETVSMGLLYKPFVLSCTMHLTIHNLAS